MQFDWRKYGSFLFFGGYLVLGLILFKDYGISWDETMNRTHALVTLDYVNQLFDNSLWNTTFSKNWTWENYPYKEYGVVFQIVCLNIEKLLGIDTFEGIYALRHFFFFFLFWIGSICFYKILKFRFSNNTIALLGTALYILIPQIFGHSFFNPKDTVALACFSMYLWALIGLSHQKTIQKLLLFILAAALFINARLFGVFLVGGGYVWLIVYQIIEQPKARKEWLFVILSLPLALLFTIAIWPHFWIDPWQDLVWGLKKSETWIWQGYALIWGEWVKASEAPWYYLPMFMGITLPLGHLILSVFGLLAFVFQFFKTQSKNLLNSIILFKTDGLMALYFWGVLAMVMISKPVIYDGWRHMFFIAAPLIYFGAYFLWQIQHLFPKAKAKNTFVIGMCLYLGFCFFQIVRWHPYQSAWFNGVAQLEKPLTHKFEMAYWGNEYKQLFSYFKNKNATKPIKCFARHVPALYNYKALSKTEQRKIDLIFDYPSNPETFYYLSIFRFDKEQSESWKEDLTKDYQIKVEHRLQVRGSDIARIYKLIPKY